VRDIPVTSDTIKTVAEGDIEAIEKVLKIVRIRVRYTLKIPQGMREKAERAVARHPISCPAANSIKGCIELDITAEITEE
jgi:organic hydroperoxide reductase OsmC/OhrA|tara:strand:- start:41 stop:280 length:240 start_codon:yes stop_codon:yes gene_type:complete